MTTPYQEMTLPNHAAPIFDTEVSVVELLRAVWKSRKVFFTTVAVFVVASAIPPMMKVPTTENRITIQIGHIGQVSRADNGDMRVQSVPIEEVPAFVKRVRDESSFDQEESGEGMIQNVSNDGDTVTINAGGTSADAVKKILSNMASDVRERHTQDMKVILEKREQYLTYLTDMTALMKKQVDKFRHDASRLDASQVALLQQYANLEKSKVAEEMAAYRIYTYPTKIHYKPERMVTSERSFSRHLAVGLFSGILAGLILSIVLDLTRRARRTA